MTLFKIVSSIILPSTFILLFLVAGLILYVSKKKGIKLIIIGTTLYLFFSITIVSDLLLYPLEKDYSPLTVEEMQEADTIVLLLGGREANVLRGSEVLRISHLTENKKRIIISGTNPLLETSTEALAVRNFFINRGIPEENIVIEGSSRNTRENVINVVSIVEEDPFFLVTSAYHMNRSLAEFEKLGSNPIPAPTDFKRKGGEYRFIDFIPHSYNLKYSDTAFHEYFGIIYYRLISSSKE